MNGDAAEVEQSLDAAQEIDSFKKTIRSNLLVALNKHEADEAESELIEQIAELKLLKLKYFIDCNPQFMKAASEIRKCLKLLHLLTDKPKPAQPKPLGDIFEKGKKVVPFKGITRAIEKVEVDTGVISEFWKGKGKKRQRITATERRDALLQRLGGKCVRCGATERLEPDHIHGATWDVTTYSLRERMDRYEEDEREGLLQALCRSCNASDGAKNRQGKARWKE